MTTYFISRHAGARDWARMQGLTIDRWVEHLELSILENGDRVIGILPLNIVAAIQSRGIRYHHLVLDLPLDLRGRELSANDMTRANAHLEEYHITRITESE